MQNLSFAICSLLLAGTVAVAQTTTEAAELSAEKKMNTPSVSLGYVILFVDNVSTSLDFYEQAFGLSRRFFNDDNGKAYGELDSGAACLAFASHEMAAAQLKQDVVFASPDKAPLGVEVALVTTDVEGLYARALKAGATPVKEPAMTPWGQTTAYVRDNTGHLVELCTPVTK